MRATLVSLILAGAVLAACEPLPSGGVSRGALKIELQAPGTASIPQEFGELIAVTSLPADPYVQMLWFEQPDQTIVAVRVNVAAGSLGSALTIPRR